MIGKVIELKNKIIDTKRLENNTVFEQVVEDALRERHYEGYTEGWRACGEKIIEEVKNIR